jgi:hypothetical protein
MDQLPLVVWLLAFTGALGIPLTTSAVLRETRAAAWGLAGVAVVWFAIDWLLAGTDAYGRVGSSNFSPGLVAALLGFLAVLVAATALPPVRRALTAPGTVARLTLPHTVRVVGVVFLIAMALGKLPALFALPAGLGDIAVGIAAPFVVRDLRRGVSGAARRARVFHLLGIADLVVAVSMGVLVGLLGVTPSMAQLTVMPLAVVPTLAVPTALALHITALRTLAAGSRAHVRTGTRVGAAV